MSSSGVSCEGWGGEDTAEKWEARRSSDSSVQQGSDCDGPAMDEIEEALDEAVAWNLGHSKRWLAGSSIFSHTLSHAFFLAREEIRVHSALAAIQASRVAGVLCQIFDRLQRRRLASASGIAGTAFH